MDANKARHEAREKLISDLRAAIGDGDPLLSSLMDGAADPYADTRGRNRVCKIFPVLGRSHKVKPLSE
jgi:hypothetical protein